MSTLIDINELLIDSIINDDTNVFLKLVIYKDQEINRSFELSNYKLPGILSNCPSYASLCCFFNAQKCLSALCDNIPGGLNSIELRKVDNRQRSPIHFAYDGGNNNIINDLLHYKYNINEKDEDRISPLHYFAMTRMISSFYYLQMNGADLLSVDIKCMTPFYTAYYYGSFNIVEFIANVSENVVIKNDFTNVNSIENNALYRSCKGNCYDVITSFVFGYINE